MEPVQCDETGRWRQFEERPVAAETAETRTARTTRYRCPVQVAVPPLCQWSQADSSRTPLALGFSLIVEVYQRAESHCLRERADCCVK